MLGARTVLKILYLCFDSGIPFWGSKGASIHIREFTKALKASGHDVDISVARLGRDTSNGAEVHELAPAQADLFRWAHGQGEGKLSREASSFAGNFTSWAPPSEDFDLVYERYSLFGVITAWSRVTSSWSHRW
jgi:hypothetical protein